MNHFELRDGELFCEDTPLSRIAESVGTPVYVYSSATLERHFQVLKSAFIEAGLKGEDGGPPLIAYAVKANPNLAVLATLARMGAGADTVSEGEIRRALAAGIPPGRIVFSGVGKREDEIRFALESGISEINVESEPELRLIARVALSLGRPARLAVRVNPDVAAGGHAKITTGGAGNKFGVSFSEAERLYAEAAADPWLKPVGLTCHIGSQISSLAPLEAAFRRMRGFRLRIATKPPRSASTPAPGHAPRSPPASQRCACHSRSGAPATASQRARRAGTPDTPPPPRPRRPPARPASRPRPPAAHPAPR